MGIASVTVSPGAYSGLSGANASTVAPAPVSYDEGKGFQCVCPNKDNGLHSCETRARIDGSAAFVTGTFGMVAASVVVRRLIAHGINPVHESSASAGGPLDGLTIVVTGRLETMSRNEAEDRIRELGGKVGSSITKGTDYLVVGAEAGTKLQKAEKLGTRQLTEEEFGKLLAGGPEGLESTSAA